MMTRQEFINYLEINEIPYSEYTENGADMVYVFSKVEYNKKKAHPRKYKNLYVPYLRVSHFDEYRWYTRDNGLCGYMSIKKVMDIVKELGAA